MNSVKKKRGLFASRAHSFKENLLDALKSGGQASTPSQRKLRPEKAAIHLAKKTSSTDNLTGHLGTAKTTDCLVKEVQFALKYFQDVVSKQTYEMLPGCATVVLETVLAIQAFAGNLDEPMDKDMKSSMDASFKAVSALTSWADNVIIEGHVDPCEDYVSTIIEPVRRAVIVVVNHLSAHIGKQCLARGNSLPDITNDNCDDDDLVSSLVLSQSSDSILDMSPIKPPLFPRFSYAGTEVAPPLPPKHTKPTFDRNLEDLLVQSTQLRQNEWFASPLFDMTSTVGRYSHLSSSQRLKHGTPDLRKPPVQRQIYNNFNSHQTLPSPRGLDTTIPDQSFEYTETNSTPASISKESLANTSFDEIDYAQHRLASLGLSSRSWSSRERSNTSSPSFETLSFGSHLSDPLDNDHPPALPRKSRDSSFPTSRKPSITSSSVSHDSDQNPRPNQRKLSQYDNMPNPESSAVLRRFYDNMSHANDQLGRHPFPSPPPPLTISKSDSFAPNLRNRYQHSTPTTWQGHHLPNSHSSISQTTWSNLAQNKYSLDSPPPLPPKKRNIMSYMEMFGKTILPSGEDLLQGIFHTQDLLHNVWQQNFHEYSEYAPSSLLHFPLDQSAFTEMEHRSLPRPSGHPAYINFSIVGSGASPPSDTPPALPPKKNRSRPGSFRSTSSDVERRIPIIREDTGQRISQLSDQSASSGSSSDMPRLSVPIPIQRVTPTPVVEVPTTPEVLEHSLLDETDVSEYLMYGTQSDHSAQSKQSSNGAQSKHSSKHSSNSSGTSELRAGTIDALVVLATQTIKNDFLYQEAFLTTYRTFMTTESLVDKLVYRFRKYNDKHNAISSSNASCDNNRVALNAYSLLVRVVDGLCDTDFQTKSLLEKLTSFITALIQSGDLVLARALRSQFIHKYEERRARLLPDFDLASLNSVNKKPSLPHFKSVDLAEQMTLLDSQLFLRIDSAELIIWVQEQNEEKSVNLTKFTEHFNNMSYWTRTLILQQPDAKERERYVMKFIKIMKCLRKLNNFNSYLAILSALDSAPIRRLEWQRNITDGLKEYCSLIDSSSSFRAYRLALAESSPPCIPYIGLVLQDLTFVHIGNPDLIDEKVNFAKRWQQFNILDNMRRFKKETYQFTRQEEILSFFAEFEEYLTEDDMWNLSESIKPRGQTNKNVK